MTRITSRHHVFSIEHLLCKLADCHGTILLGATACEWCKAWHEEVKSWEWYHVHRQFSQISIQLENKEYIIVAFTVLLTCLPAAH